MRKNVVLHIRQDNKKKKIKQKIYSQLWPNKKFKAQKNINNKKLNNKNLAKLLF